MSFVTAIPGKGILYCDSFLHITVNNGDFSRGAKVSVFLYKNRVFILCIPTNFQFFEKIFKKSVQFFQKIPLIYMRDVISEVFATAKVKLCYAQ